MPRKLPPPLSRRERQVMDILYAAGWGSVGSVWDVLRRFPTRPATRPSGLCSAYWRKKATPSIAMTTGGIFTFQPPPALLQPRVPSAACSKPSSPDPWRTLSPAHLADPSTKLSADDLERLTSLIRQAKEREP